MRRIAAFFTALVLFLGFVLGMHGFTRGRLKVDNPDFGTWTDEVKFGARDAMAVNMNEDSLLVMGSSELQHGKGTEFHPESIFRGQKTNLMLVGAGYYQSLFHATALAALEPDMKNRKAVLILAPQWFRKAGVVSKAYASRFSEMNFVAMLKNQDLSGETKEYIVQRSEELLKVDEPTLERVRRYERLYLTGESSWMDKIYAQSYGMFLEEKSRVSVVNKMRMSGITSENGKTETFQRNSARDRLEEKTGPLGGIDFEELRVKAVEEGKKQITNNPFYVKDSYFTKNLKPKMEAEKDKGVKTGYSESPEYEDLDCFLRVCQETGIEPLLVVVPVNGYWYDYTGFNKEKRQEYYDNIRKMADTYQVKVADFSDREYEPYFMEDTIHLGWKGWVDVSEAIYKFAQENE